MFDGRFLIPIVERLFFWKARHPDVPWAALRTYVRAVDVDPAALDHARERIEQVLRDSGCTADAARMLPTAWLRKEDFLLSSRDLRADVVVGNPPYVRAADIPKGKREAYAARLSCVTTGADLYVGFFEKAFNLLRPGGVLGFIASDRWLQNGYGRHLRGKVNNDFNLTTLVRLHDVRAFEEDVDAYPAITLIRNEPREDVFTFVNCGRAFGEEHARSVRTLEALRRAEAGEGRGEESAERRGWQRGFKSAAPFEVIHLPKPEDADLYPLADTETVRFVTEAMRRFQPVEVAGVTIGIGIATGCDEVFLTEDASIVEASRLLPIHHARREEKLLYMVNPWEEDGSLVDLRLTRSWSATSSTIKRASRPAISRRRTRRPGFARSTRSSPHSSTAPRS